MKDLKAFSTTEEIFDILGWEYTGDYRKDEALYDKLWDNGFNLDDWDGGFACREPLHYKEKDEDDEECPEWTEFYPDVEWLGMEMRNYCVGYNYCFFEGWHWYTVHHS